MRTTSSVQSYSPYVIGWSKPKYDAIQIPLFSRVRLFLVAEHDHDSQGYASLDEPNGGPGVGMPDMELPAPEDVEPSALE